MIKTCKDSLRERDRERERERDRDRDRDRQTDRQRTPTRDRQTDRQTDRQRDRETTTKKIQVLLAIYVLLHAISFHLSIGSFFHAVSQSQSWSDISLRDLCYSERQREPIVCVNLHPCPPTSHVSYTESL